MNVSAELLTALSLIVAVLLAVWAHGCAGCGWSFDDEPILPVSPTGSKRFAYQKPVV